MKNTRNSMLIILATLGTLTGTASGSTPTESRGSVNLFAAEYPPPAGTKGRPPHSDGLLFLADEALSSEGAAAYRAFEAEMSIELTFGQATAAALNRLLSRYPDRRLALSHAGEVLATPTLGKALVGDSIRVSFDDRTSFTKALRALAMTERADVGTSG